jgi:hypothetical protein
MAPIVETINEKTCVSVEKRSTKYSKLVKIASVVIQERIGAGVVS